MGRTEAASGLVAKRPMATTSGASLPRDVSVLSMVADLEGHDLDGLRRQWRAHLGGEAPAHLPRWLLMRVLAYQLQSDAFGDLDKTIRRNLRSEKDDGAGVPFDRRAPQTRQGVALKAGALLVREWKGRLERVMILEEGFAWNGQTFGSLSQIAKAMTGTNWNGHRFFGLRHFNIARSGGKVSLMHIPGRPLRTVPLHCRASLAASLQAAFAACPCRRFRYKPLLTKGETAMSDNVVEFKRPKVVRLSMPSDGDMPQSCAQNLRVALSDREASLEKAAASRDLVALLCSRKPRRARFADRGSFSARPIWRQQS